MKKEYSRVKEYCFSDYVIPNRKDCYSEIELKEYLKSFLNRFDDNSKNIYKKLLDGWSIKEIAKDVGFSPNNISNIIRRKIRPELAKNYC